jgi:hypothetical protein
MSYKLSLLFFHLCYPVLWLWSRKYVFRPVGPQIRIAAPDSVISYRTLKFENYLFGLFTSVIGLKW